MFYKFANWMKNNRKEIVVEEVDGIFYPSEKSVIFLHDYLIRELRLDESEIHEGIISAGVLSFSGIKYYLKKLENKREDIVRRGAEIFNKFLQAGHPFVDGNKRTGFATLWLFLLLNGIELKLSILEYKNHAKQIEKWADIGKDSIEEIYNWLDKYCE